MKRFTHISTTLLISVVGLLILTPLLAGIIPSDSINNFTSVAHAQDNYEFLAPIGGFEDEIDISSEDSFPQYIQTVITMTIGFAILAAIVLIVMAGFKYMTTTSKGGVDDAKQWIQNAVLGLILALASVVILQTINPNLVELNSVDTVTTSGSDFSVVEYGLTECRKGDTDCRGGKYCYNVKLNVSIGGGGDTPYYQCYDSLENCNNGRENSSVEWASSCKFRYEAFAYVDQKEDIDENGTLEKGIKLSAIGESREEALEACESQLDNPETAEDENFKNFCSRGESYSVDGDCEVVQECQAEGVEEGDKKGEFILSFPDGSFQQFNSLAACEVKESEGGASGDCYEATPDNIFQRNILSPPNNGESIIRNRLSEAQQIGEPPSVEYVPPMSVNKSSCNSVGDSDCTNVGGLSPAALEGLRDLNEDVTESCRDGSDNYQEGCSLRVTGGTEWWLHGNKEEDPFTSVGDTAHHPVGLGNGIRTGAVDLGFQDNLNSYVEDNYDPVGQTDNGYSIYNIGGNQFIKEPSHWHVQFGAY